MRDADEGIYREIGRTDGQLPMRTQRSTGSAKFVVERLGGST